jgi:hypothetical protein
MVAKPPSASDPHTKKQPGKMADLMELELPLNSAGPHVERPVLTVWHYVIGVLVLAVRCFCCCLETVFGYCWTSCPFCMFMVFDFAMPLTWYPESDSVSDSVSAPFLVIPGIGARVGFGSVGQCARAGVSHFSGLSWFVNVQ